MTCKNNSTFYVKLIDERRELERKILSHLICHEKYYFLRCGRGNQLSCN